MSFGEMSDNLLIDCMRKGSLAIRKSARKEAVRRGMSEKKFLSIIEEESDEGVENADVTHMLSMMDPDSAMEMENIMELYHSCDDEMVKEAKKQVVCKFGKYVQYIIHNYFSSFEAKYSPELFNSGIIGLLNAMKMYDGSYAFTTYSKNFIIHEMMEFTHFITNIPSPHYARLQKKVRKAKEELERSDSVKTDLIKEISSITKLSEKAVRREIDVINRTNFIYIDDPNEDTSIESGYSNDPCEDAERNILFEKVIKEISSLDANTRYVIFKKIFDQYEYSEIAEKTGLDVKQVKSLYSKGMYALTKKIRNF